MRITEKGIKVVDAALVDLLNREKELLKSLKSQERDELAGFLSRILENLEGPNQ